MLQLRPNLSCCLCGDRVLFLDLDADRYFCLGRGLEASFRNWLAGEPTESDLNMLQARSILQPGERASRAGSLPTRAMADLEAAPRARRRDLAEALAFELIAAAWLRIRPIGAVIKGCARHSRHADTAAGGAAAAAAASAIVAGLAESALWLGSTDRCLPRAIAATLMCRRRRVAAHLVLGVRIDPFGAHAWVQCQDKILVGDFDQVRLFTPILSVP